MIRLRREIDRALANRWLRILLVLLLVGLFLLFVIHTTHDAIADGEAFACVALVVLLVVILPPQVRLRALSPRRVERTRGPPPLALEENGLTPISLKAIPLRR